MDICFNRTIWVLWFQGEANAPYLVKKCIDSWKKHNSNWKVVVLDRVSMFDYIDIDLSNTMMLAHQSDFVRLKLLSQYGGVWVDATTFCMRPLDTWLFDYMTEGFFMFKKPEWKRGVSNWFIASEQSNYIIVKLLENFTAYWNEDLLKKDSKLNEYIKKYLSYLLHKREYLTKYWFLFFIKDILKIYPYFAFHYLLERILLLDDKAALIWEHTGKLSNGPPHLIQEYGMLKECTDEIMQKVSFDSPPVYKLAFRYDESKYLPGTLLYYLLEEKYFNISFQ